MKAALIRSTLLATSFSQSEKLGNFSARKNCTVTRIAYRRFAYPPFLRHYSEWQQKGHYEYKFFHHFIAYKQFGQYATACSDARTVPLYLTPCIILLSHFEIAQINRPATIGIAV